MNLLHCVALSIPITVSLLGCSEGDPEDPERVDGGSGDLIDASTRTGDSGVGSPDAGGGAGGGLTSSLVSDCGATFSGRAIVNFNGNLGISFTDGESPFTFRGSIQFELPSSTTGSIPNPEDWDGSSPRQIIAMTNPGFTLHGNHCWMQQDANPAGSVLLSDYRPAEGIVNAEFSSLRLHSCVGDAVCTLNGSIETTGEGVFE